MLVGIVELAAQRLAELELDNSGMDCFYPVCTPMVVVWKVLKEDDKEEEVEKVSRQQLGKYCLILLVFDHQT